MSTETVIDQATGDFCTGYGEGISVVAGSESKGG
jgi:hypothetical protein